MIRTLLLFCGLIFFTSLVHAQSKAEKQVASAVEKLRVAMLDANREALDQLVMDELNYGHSTGRVEDKAAFIQAFISGDSDFKTIELTGHSIQIVGKSAVVRHLLTGETNDKGVAGTAKIAVMQVWQKKQGQWRLLARQAVKV